MAASSRGRSARGPGVVLVAATGAAAAAVALDAGLDLPAPLRVLLFAGWAVAVGVLGWCTLGRRGQRPGEAVAAGGVAVAAFGLAVVCVPGGTRAGRLAPPWIAEPPPARLTVTTGDPVVVRGAGVTLACVADRRTNAAVAVRLDVRAADGSCRPQAAAEELPGVFAVRLPAVAEPVDYRFAVGPTVTAWHRVTPAEPVALTAASGFVSTPPTCAAGQFPTRRFNPDEQISCLAGGRVAAAVEFDRPAADVRVVWQPDDGSPALPLRVEVAEGRRAASFAAVVSAAGRFEVTLTADPGLRSEVRVPVSLIRDQPPQFVAVTGLEAGRWEVRRGLPLVLSVEVSDDVWAAPPTLVAFAGSTQETAIQLPLPLTATGGGRFTGRLAVPLGTGPTNVRLRLTDGAANRSHFPADGWAVFTPTDHASPVAEQFILAQRTRVADRLADAISALDRNEDVSAVADRLLGVADDLSHVVELEPLVARLRAAVALLRSSGAESKPLSELDALNRRTAAERLDRVRLTELAAVVRSLANAQPTRAEVTRVRERLAAVVAASPRLTAARAAADAQALTDAAAAAARLADDLEAASDALRADRSRRAAPLSARLTDLSKQIEAASAGVLGRTGRPAEQLAAALRALADGRPADALPPLDAAGRELMAAADTSARLADARRDPREAARQLLGWQAVLNPRNATDTKRFEAAVAELLAVTRRHRPAGCDTLAAIAREYPAATDLRRRAASELKGVLENPQSAATRSEMDALLARLTDLPPAGESERSMLAAAAVRRTIADFERRHDRQAGLAEVQWRLDRLVRELTGAPDPAEVSGSVDRLSAFAVRIGLPPTSDSPEQLREAVRARLAGYDSDLDRVRLIARWWATRPAVGPDQWRQLGELLGKVRGEDEPTLAAAVRLASAGGRAMDGQTALDRLAEAFARQPERQTPLAACGPHPPTAAERLVHLDTGGRLGSHPTATMARTLAGEVSVVARQVAVASAEAERADANTAREADFSRVIARIRVAFDQPRISTEAVELLVQAETALTPAGEAGDRWVMAATTLRLLPCFWNTAPPADSQTVKLGRLLSDADGKLMGGGPDNDIRHRLGEVSKLIQVVGQ